MYRQLSARAAALGAEASREASGTTNLTINVHFHVINKGAALGVIPRRFGSCATTACCLPLVRRATPVATAPSQCLPQLTHMQIRNLRLNCMRNLACVQLAEVYKSMWSGRVHAQYLERNPG